jgi:hypothetical protein
MRDDGRQGEGGYGKDETAQTEADWLRDEIVADVWDDLHRCGWSTHEWTAEELWFLCHCLMPQRHYLLHELQEAIRPVAGPIKRAMDELFRFDLDGVHDPEARERLRQKVLRLWRWFVDRVRTQGLFRRDRMLLTYEPWFQV